MLIANHTVWQYDRLKIICMSVWKANADGLRNTWRQKRQRFQTCKELEEVMEMAAVRIHAVLRETKNQQHGNRIQNKHGVL